jgi:hypothetical protein
MDPIKKLEYLVLAFNVISFCFGALWGLQLAKLGRKDDETES